MLESYTRTPWTRSLDGFQPARKFPNNFLTWVIGPTNHIEGISRQRHVECLDKLARRKLVRHEPIAEKAKSLAGNYGLNRMQLFPEAQMLHVLELRNVAPFSSGKSKPPLPGWRIEVGGRPI